MSRNRLSELQPGNGYNSNQTYPEGQYDNVDLERNDVVAGERYELQDRSGRELSLNAFLDEINDSRETTSRLDAQITRIEQLHAESMASTDVGSTSHAEMDSLVASTSSLINSIRANLEQLGNDARKGGPDAKRKVDLVNAQRKRLQDRVQRFQKIEQAYRDKLRDRAIRQYRIVNPDMSDQELSTALSDPDTQIFQQALMSSTRSSQAQSTLREVQSRHNDIVTIERKITELAQMFTELGVMVEFAEVPIANIEVQADNTRQTMDAGLQQVSRATKLAAAARRKKWWCFGIFLIIIIVIVVVVVVTQVVQKKA